LDVQSEKITNLSETKNYACLLLIQHFLWLKWRQLYDMTGYKQDYQQSNSIEISLIKNSQYFLYNVKHIIKKSIQK
jgi:hypothetical protein